MRPCTGTPGPTETRYLRQEGHGIVVPLRGHLSDQVFGAVFQQLLFNGIATHKPSNKTDTRDSRGRRGSPEGVPHIASLRRSGAPSSLSRCVPVSRTPEGRPLCWAPMHPGAHPCMPALTLGPARGCLLPPTEQGPPNPH